MDEMIVAKVLNGEVELEHSKMPFRVGRKLNRAVLDADGKQVVVFEPGRELLASIFVYLMNKHLA